MVELIISALVLMTVMTFITTISFQISLVWKDIAQHRVAVNELSNQLDRLTRLDLDEAQAAIEGLQASGLCAQTLNEPKLSGQVTEDELGNRIELQIDWVRRNPGQPVKLVGWLPAQLSNVVDSDSEFRNNPIATDSNLEKTSVAPQPEVVQ